MKLTKAETIIIRKVLLCGLLLLSGFSRITATENKLWQIIPFTGTDYIRITVDNSFRTAPSNTFRMVITSIKDSTVLWQGPVNPQPTERESVHQLAFTVSNLKPALWSPAHPHLYEVTLQQFSNGKLQNEASERTGFRSFERRGGNLYLNGKPIFLKGIAINPPNRGIPPELEKSREFALDYVRFMKSIHVNIIRIPDEEAWFDVCDELGMMVFGGNYSSRVASGAKVERQAQVGDEGDGGFPKDYEVGIDWYIKDKLGPIAHHPSLMVYAMTNETPFVGERARQWEDFLSYAHTSLKKWDETRVYIANAGYGYGKAGDIIDIHRYWGWYYSSPFTFLHIRDNAKIIPFPKDGMPITFTECVGNYTGPDGRYNLTPSHKNPSSQLAWTGHEQQALQSALADRHQSFTVRQATELFRQLRHVNHDLSGIFPFTILFYNWNTIREFADMKPKPVTEQVKRSYQPVLLSWELWATNVYHGSTIKPVIHVINDHEEFKDLRQLKVVYKLIDKASRQLLADSLTIGHLPYYAKTEKEVTITLPDDLPTGDYKLVGTIWEGDQKLSENHTELFIAGRQYAATPTRFTETIYLHDPAGKTAALLKKKGIAFRAMPSLKNISADGTVVIGENGADQTVVSMADDLKAFVKKGGRLLVLRQDSLHLSHVNHLLPYAVTNHTVDIDDPRYPTSAIPPRTGYYVNPERPEHPIFSGITRAHLRVWSDYTDWNPTRPGLPAIQPVRDGFMLKDHQAVGSTAILGNYGSGLQAIAIAEQFSGKGSILLTGLDLVNRGGLDPVADRMLLNLLQYMGSPDEHHAHPLITAPIIWGEYETEKGLVTDLYSGFLVNSTPRLPQTGVGPRHIVVTKEGYQLAGGARGGFNNRPGIQYVANGRRPWGPFSQSFGGQPRLIDQSAEGTGQFWCRIPAGRSKATSLVWNPGNEPLQMKIRINQLPEVNTTIPAGEKIFIDCPVDSGSVHLTYTGDRRLVILETTFL